jgi:S1-C subfamily serine protease
VAIAPIAVGADVYAIGAPLSTSLSNTLTRGVVSGYRVFDGVSHIQSDVSIQPGDSGGPLLDESGNVVGLTRAAMRLGSSTTGVNFFIPITVALQAVNVAIDGGLR